MMKLLPLLLPLLSNEAFAFYSAPAPWLTSFPASRNSAISRTTRTTKKRTLLNASGPAGGGLFGDDTRRDSVPSSSSKFDTTSSSSPNGKFATGKELKRLRSDLDSLRENLIWAQAMKDEDRIDDISKAIKNGEKRDPDLTYKRALREIINAKASYLLPVEERKCKVKKWEEEAADARQCLARFHLEGLWVGSYGDNGQELINVTYSGDTLIASKVTGDTNVPRGKISFSAELSPPNSSSLEPLKVSFENEATQLLRYPGKGQVAQPGFVNSKYIQGQMVMFDKHFSFVWIPTRHHVLFRRPTPEQTICLLRDTIAKEDELENMRSYVARCFDMDMTESLARFHALRGKEEPLRRISLNSELPGDGDGSGNSLTVNSNKDDNARFSFWKVNKWRDYIDRVMGDNTNEKK
eukprot:CAMPEP_0198149968 /NCGR_PEP_ID=MMETSP1443-20131203/48812_1 /TAXON_ID=186043 /ORGANISM="Entomoneis sp., Strain CCMP2396" /LENGTH=408 /DNA_ID=CAMNT_0043815143 /DNA_START=17 /DNA_END=1243 /DNA_ORIENTATION=+